MEDHENVYMTLTVGNTFVNIAAATIGSYLLTDVIRISPGMDILISSVIMVFINPDYR